MKLDKPLMVASGSNLLPRIVRALLLVLIVVIALALLAAAKPWKLGVPMPEWNLKQCIRVSLWWAGLLGEVRDLDILAQRQAALLAELPAELILGPVASTIEVELAVQRKQAADAMAEALDSERFRKLIGLMHHWRADPPFTPAADVSAASRVARSDRPGAEAAGPAEGRPGMTA